MKHARHRRRGTRRRVLATAGAACLAAATIGLAGTGGSAGAQEAPGSGLLSYSLSATAPGAQVKGPSDLGVEIPLSLAQLQSGPQGYALSSLAWPGPIIGNAGALAGLLGLPIPPEVLPFLNYPIRAEARTGAGPTEARNDTVPGITMASVAREDLVRSDAAVTGSAGPAAAAIVSNAAIATTSEVKLVGPGTVEAFASSLVTNLAIADVLTIESVRSVATGKSDGKVGSGTARTTVAGVEVAGIPVAVGHEGLRVADTTNPVNAALSEVVNGVLESAGIQVFVSPATERRSGAAVVEDAGSLVVLVQDQFTVTLGGARLSLDASPGDPSATPGLDIPVDGVLGGTTGDVPATGSGSFDPLAPVDAPLADGSAGGTGGATTGATGAAPGAPILVGAPASSSSPLPDGVAWGWVLLALVGSGLVAAGLWRLPDRALEGVDAACILGGQP